MRIYVRQDCTELAAVGSAEELASGIQVPVPQDSTTELHANATDAASHISPCSSRLTYVEAPVEVQANPGLFPGFDPNVSDYVTRCDGTDPVSVSVDAPHGSSVSVDGSAPADGTYDVPVALQAGQEFTFSASAATYSRTFYVRCVPSDLPSWTFERFSPPNNRFYAFDPNPGSGPRYAVVFDDHGVPVWWFDAASRPRFTHVLSDGSIAFGRQDGAGYEIHSLDGTLLRTAKIVGSSTDFHDMQELGNGDALLLSYRSRSGGDLSRCGGSSETTVVDGVIQEIDPSGNLVHEWNSADYVAPDETPTRWCTNVLVAGDIVHINSVEPDGDALIVSFRHLDAVYKIDRATGAVIWKLGGTPTPQSLTVLNDPYGSYAFGGQHDARLQPDGTITIHDNGTALSGHPPRAVRYAIDESAHTATLVGSVSDPDVPSSACCGSARRAASGAWLMSWGANPVVTEFAPDGRRAFRLTISDGSFSYRAFPVPDGLLTASALRAGMTTQFPRP